MAGPTVGVLALQGAFARHRSALEALGAEVREVRRPGQLDGLDGLVVPGGESTTMSRLLDTSGLRAELVDAIEGGLAVFGTCAGAILLAREVLDGRADQRSVGALDVVIRRNGYGRQIDSFEVDLDVSGLDEPFHAVFIRAPRIESTGADVEVWARFRDVPVVARQERVLAATFHPELTDDLRLHRRFLDII